VHFHSILNEQLCELFANETTASGNEYALARIHIAFNKLNNKFVCTQQDGNLHCLLDTKNTFNPLVSSCRIVMNRLDAHCQHPIHLTEIKFIYF